MSLRLYACSTSLPTVCARHFSATSLFTPVAKHRDALLEVAPATGSNLQIRAGIQSRWMPASAPAARRAPRRWRGRGAHRPPDPVAGEVSWLTSWPKARVASCRRGVWSQGRYTVVSAGRAVLTPRRASACGSPGRALKIQAGWTESSPSLRRSFLTKSRTTCASVLLRSFHT